MGIRSVVAGVLGGPTWTLKNLDTNDTIQGQFEATDLTENVGAKYSKIYSLNRQNPILQYIGGDLETTTFQARLWNQLSGATAAFAATSGGAASDVLEKLKSWVKRSDSKGRPPILEFSAAGDHPVKFKYCVIESLGGIKYDPPTMLGKMRGATLFITLLRYEPYTLEGYFCGETRYHRAKSGDYYELLTHHEYGNANMGDIIRKRHPEQPNIQTAGIVKLPSVEVLRKEKVEQTSIPLKTSFGRKDTPQRALRLAMLEKRNVSYVSHIVRE